MDMGRLGEGCPVTSIDLVSFRKVQGRCWNAFVVLIGSKVPTEYFVFEGDEV